MKKYVGSLMAILAVITAFAFNKMPEKPNATYYWFGTNAGGTSVTQPARSDMLSADDPSGCTTGASFCSLAYSASKTTLNGSGHRVLASGITASDRDNFSKRP